MVSAEGAGVFSGGDFGIEPVWNGRHDMGLPGAFQFKVLLDAQRRGARECRPLPQQLTPVKQGFRPCAWCAFSYSFSWQLCLQLSELPLAGCLRVERRGHCLRTIAPHIVQHRLQMLRLPSVERFESNQCNRSKR